MAMHQFKAESKKLLDYDDQLHLHQHAISSCVS